MRLPLKISVLMIISMLLLTGCFQKSGGNPDSVSQSIQSESESDGAGDSEMESAVIWPQYKMGDLPEPVGEIISVTDNDDGTHVSIEGMSGGDAEDYLQRLKDLGYSAIAEGEDDNGGIIFSAVRDNLTVVFMYDPSGGSSPDKSLCQITLEKKA